MSTFPEHAPSVVSCRLHKLTLVGNEKIVFVGGTCRNTGPDGYRVTDCVCGQGDKAG
jgi:hypothetical protein